MTHPIRAFQPPRPLVIGLLGGVAAGKSTVAGMFSNHGLAHVDADAIARDVTRRSDVRDAIAAAFGGGVLAADGALDRAALADLVFSDPAARRRLEGITHPAIRREIESRLEAARSEGRSVLLDAPLLLEGGLIERCDATVFVAASAGTRRARAAARGWEPGELERREASQAPLNVKMRRSAYTIQNDRSLRETARQVAEILARLDGGAPPAPASRGAG